MNTLTLKATPAAPISKPLPSAAPVASPLAGAPRHVAIHPAPHEAEPTAAAWKSIADNIAAWSLEAGCRVLTLGLPQPPAAPAAWRIGDENSASLSVQIMSTGSGRAQIAAAIRRLAEDARSGKIKPDEIDSAALESRLPTASLPPVDLLIRTGGSHCVSDLLLWQASYAEIVFIDTPLAQLDRTGFRRALEDFTRRCRKFGGLAPA